jgi:hypothetical protein
LKPKNASERQRDFEAIAAKNAEVRREFVLTELQTCHTALQIGIVELAGGNLATGEKEITAAEECLRIVRRFLPGVEAEHRGEAQGKLAEMQSALDLLKSRASAKRRG